MTFAVGAICLGIGLILGVALRKSPKKDYEAVPEPGSEWL